jgi:hypothetical protein
MANTEQIEGAKTAAKKPFKQKENLYQAEYLGSGTFKITKPKRRSAKRRQSALKNRRRGSRK